jgi:hypothetical protein
MGLSGEQAKNRGQKRFCVTRVTSRVAAVKDCRKEKISIKDSFILCTDNFWNLEIHLMMMTRFQNSGPFSHAEGLE